MLALPIIANSLWTNYFRSTHDFFSRIEHSFSNLVVLAKSFDAQHKLLFINFLKCFAQFLIKEGSLVIYALIAISWYRIKKYRQDLFSEYKFLMFNLGIFFILFSIWRLYLYYFTFTYNEARGASLIRYLGSYCIAFAMISCAYIKESYSQVNHTRPEDTKLKFLLIIFVMIFMSAQVVHTILRTKKLTFDQIEQNAQLKIVKQLIANDYIVEFNFENKPYDDLSCYYLNYKIAPYFSTQTLSVCLKATPLQKDQIKKFVSFTSAFDWSNMSKDKCKVFYSPFVNVLEVICSE